MNYHDDFVHFLFYRDGISTQSGDCLLIIQCYNGDQNLDLIACARYRVMDELNASSDKFQPKAHVHVLFIVQLPRISGGTRFPAYQGGLWISCHVDDLHGSVHTGAAIHDALQKPFHKFFTSLLKDGPSSNVFSVYILFQNAVHKAASKLVMQSSTDVRVRQVIKDLLNLIPEGKF